MEIIERYKSVRKGNRLFSLKGGEHANRRLKRILKACGIDKHVSWHGSRHSFACLALNKGMPIESVSKILGHTNITTTQIYAKIMMDKLDGDMSAFGDKMEAGFAKARAAKPSPVIIPMPTAAPRAQISAVN